MECPPPRTSDTVGLLSDAIISAIASPASTSPPTVCRRIRIPQNYVELTDETAVKNLQRTLDLLEDDDDVQAVYHNWDE